MASQSHRGSGLSSSQALAWSAALLAGAALVNNEAAKRTERRHPPKGNFVAVDGVRLHYLQRGEGTPVVLIHGNSVMADDFEISGVMDLVARHHRVIAFDRPGFGYSERPRSTVWTAEAQAALIGKALHQIGIDRCTVVGHSWGSLVALALALNAPAQVSALVLMSGYYFPSVRLDVPVALLPSVPVVGDIMRYSVSPLTALLTAPMVFKKIFAPLPVTDRFKKYFRVGMIARPSQIRAEAAEAALMIPAAASMLNRHAELAMPVMIVAGSEDKIVATQSQSVRLHHDIGQSHLREISGVGHMVHHSAPKQVAEAIEEIAA